MRNTRIDEDAITANMTDIRGCTLDEVKVISATFFVTVHGAEGGDEAVQQYIDTMQMHKAGETQY